MHIIEKFCDIFSKFIVNNNEDTLVNVDAK